MRYSQEGIELMEPVVVRAQIRAGVRRQTTSETNGAFSSSKKCGCTLTLGDARQIKSEGSERTKARDE